MSRKNQLKRRLRIAFALLAVGITVTIAPLDLLPVWIAPLPDSVKEQVDAAIEEGLDGIIVYVDQAGKPPAFYSAGWKNKQLEVPADPHALFKIASVNKLYVAAALTKMAHKGILSLDDTLSTHMPELSVRIANADRVTLRMMVRHRSGIPNFTDDQAFDWFEPMPDEDAILELIQGDPADFEPDSDYSYSNSNYVLLRMVMDTALEYSHRQFIRDEILVPLGLTHVYFDLDEVAYDDVVSGYWYEYDDDLRELGGSTLATAQDVGAFVRALNDGSLFTKAEEATYSSIYEYGHDGWVPGYHTKAWYHEDIDAVVVQFVNTTGGATWGTANIVGGKATGISSIIYGRIIRILRKQQ